MYSNANQNYLKLEDITPFKGYSQVVPATATHIIYPEENYDFVDGQHQQHNYHNDDEYGSYVQSDNHYGSSSTNGHYDYGYGHGHGSGSSSSHSSSSSYASGNGGATASSHASTDGSTYLTNLQNYANTIQVPDHHSSRAGGRKLRKVEMSYSIVFIENVLDEPIVVCQQSNT